MTYYVSLHIEDPTLGGWEIHYAGYSRQLLVGDTVEFENIQECIPFPKFFAIGRDALAIGGFLAIGELINDWPPRSNTIGPGVTLRVDIPKIFTNRFLPTKWLEGSWMAPPSVLVFKKENDNEELD